MVVISVLKNTLRKYDDKLANADNGNMPLNRPSGFNKIERRKQKNIKKRSWGSKGNCLAPIILPATPNSELLRRMKVVMDNSKSKYKFTLVEKGGRTLQSLLINNNPMSSGKCDRSKL